jgi:hypothetical protein
MRMCHDSGWEGPLAGRLLDGCYDVLDGGGSGEYAAMWWCSAVGVLLDF